MKKKHLRSEMQLEDLQVRIFNGRGWVCPIEYSSTGFLEPNFATLHAFYAFWFNYLDMDSKVVIHDNVSKVWKKWVEEGEDTDPLGSNFRKGFKKLVVSQDEYWSPGKYERNAIFNKEIGSSVVNIKIYTETVVDHLRDRVYLKVVLGNNGDKTKKIKLLPNHELTRKNLGKAQITSANEVSIDGKTKLVIQSNVKADKEGFLVELKSREKKELVFAFNFWRGEKPDLGFVSQELFQDFNKALANIDKRLTRLTTQLPTFKSDYTPFENLYNGSILTLNECMWERQDFLSNPFWSVGSWLFTINWDFSFSSNAIAFINTESLLQAVWNPIVYGKMKNTWVSWHKQQNPQGAGIFYIQELPSTIQILETYLQHTNNIHVLSEKKAGKTLLEWLKVWFERVIQPYINQDNLLDVKNDTEILIEIRTDGYDHVVPNTNILVADVLFKIARYCKLVNDKDATKYLEKARLMQAAINRFLWDEKNRWFSNLNKKNQRENIYTYHLFDTLGSEVISYEQKMKLLSHIKEGEFLGKYGFYSISKQDTSHYDRIDADWGGGGQFAGMPGRIATNCFKLGANYKAHEILKKLARWTSVFPYQPQNARTEQPLIDLSSMAIQVSSGASIEAIVFGLFGINVERNKIIISPNYHEDYGQTSIENVQFGNTSISVHLNKNKYQVFVNKKEVCHNFYGEKCEILKISYNCQN